MSERTLNQQNGAQPPALDEIRLSDRRAAAPTTHQSQNADANLDLANLSIESRTMVRLSHRPERRMTTTERSHARTTAKHNSKQTSHQAPAKRFGLFKNPRYNYEGGPLGILISFFANLLKVLEQFFFRARIVTAPTRPQMQSPFPLPHTEQKRKTKEEEEREGSTPSLPRLS